MIVFLSLIVLIVIVIFAYMQLPKFGKAPDGKRLERMQQSPHYRNGKFHNLEHTPNVTEGYSMTSVLYDFIFTKFPRTRPMDSIPTVVTDLKNLPPDENVLVWFGHSSYFIQLNGKRFLIDPVFSGNASPIPNSNKAFIGTDAYSVDDMPEIDYLLITHDHYDHLDYLTVTELKSKVKNIICGLGVGAHFEHWKFDPSIITEKDWNEKIELADSITLHTTTARHFSGRGFKRNNTLWLSFVLEAPDYRIFLGGDSGYGTHFREIGEKFGGFDLAILENGQYNEAWRAIHLLPEEVLAAAQDLQTKHLLPVHSSKFKLAFHAWDEPLKTLSALNDKSGQLPLLTPKIGEVVYLRDSSQTFTPWWRDLH